MASNTALTAVENKIPSVSNLVKETDNNRKIHEIERKITDHNHDKYNGTPEFNNLTSENIAATPKQANLASKSDIANFAKRADFDNKLKDNISNKNK